MNIITAQGRGELALKVLLRSTATHGGAYGGYTLEERPEDDDAFVFTEVGCAPAHSFALRVKGSTIWASDQGFIFACNVLLTNRIHFNWTEQELPNLEAARAAFRAAA